MSHVDEGALHAYLDGALDEYPIAEAERIRAHLDECAACAERLEVERAVRSDAHAILAQASPNVDLPSLEELRAYVQRTRPAPSKISVRMYRMGWAASVVLAIGTGWILRDGQLAVSSSEAFQASQDAAPVEAAGLPSVTTEEMEEATQPVVLDEASVAPPADVAGGSSAEPPAEALVRDVAATQALRAREAAPAAPAVAEDEAIALDEVVPSGVSEVVAEAPAPADPTVNEAATPELSDLASPERLADSILSGAGVPSNAFADLGAVERQRAEVAGIEPEPDAGAGQTEGTADPEEDEDRERRRSDSRVALTSALDQTSASRGNAADDVELEVLAAGAIPGLDVVEVANFPSEGTQYFGSHITQRMADGTLIHVYRLEAEVEPDVLGALAEGENEAMAQIDEEWVVVRGSRSTEELEEFILRLTPDEG